MDGERNGLLRRLRVRSDRRLSSAPARSEALFWQNALRTKPFVPQDCRRLDHHYWEAGRVAYRMAEGLIQAEQGQDEAAFRAVFRQRAEIRNNLQAADQELGRIRTARRLPDDWSIRTAVLTP